MKITSALLALLILVPAIILACHCCPAAAQDGAFMIEKASSHSCCSEKSEIVRDCGNLKEKPVFEMPAAAVVTTSAPAIHALIPAAREIAFPERASPPITPLALSVVLRI